MPHKETAKTKDVQLKREQERISGGGVPINIQILGTRKDMPIPRDPKKTFPSHLLPVRTARKRTTVVCVVVGTSPLRVGGCY